MHEWVKINLKDSEPCCARSDRAMREVRAVPLPLELVVLEGFRID
jgi:hypothetical protein